MPGRWSTKKKIVVGLGTGFFVFVLAVFILSWNAGLIDELPPDDRRLTITHPPVPDSDNAYVTYRQILALIPEKDRDADRLGRMLHHQVPVEPAEIQEQMVRHQKALALLDAMCRQPQFRTPGWQAGDFSVQSPRYAPLHFLTLLKNARLRQSPAPDPATVARDVECLLNVAHQQEEARETLIAYAVAVSIRRDTLRSLNGELDRNRLSSSELTRMSALLDARRPDKAAWQDIFRTEYLNQKATLDQLHKDPQYLILSKTPLYQPNRIKRALMERAEGIIRLFDEPYFTGKPIPKCEVLDDPEGTRQPNAVGRQLLEGICPRFGPLDFQFFKQQSVLDMLRLKMALMAYRQDYARLPDHLSALVPRYLPAVPVDALSGKPYRYWPEQGLVLSRGTVDTTDFNPAWLTNGLTLAECSSNQCTAALPLRLKEGGYPEIRIAVRLPD